MRSTRVAAKELGGGVVTGDVWPGVEAASVEVPTFDTFVAARSAALLRSAYLLTGEIELAQDLLQTAWSKVWPRWDRVMRGGDPEPYVRRVLYTTYASWWRRRWTGERPTDVLPEAAGADDHALAELRSVLVSALAQLSRRQRAVVVLRYFNDLTEAEIAEALGCSVGSVKTHLFRAMGRLRQSPVLVESGSGEDQT